MRKETGKLRIYRLAEESLDVELGGGEGELLDGVDLLREGAVCLCQRGWRVLKMFSLENEKTKDYFFFAFPKPKRGERKKKREQ